MTYKKSSDYSKFEGRWHNGKLLNGTLLYKNGDSFKGLFCDGRRHFGVLTFANGGDLVESKDTRRSNHEKLISISEKDKSDLIWTQFRGVWHDDTNSEGTLTYKNGDSFKGLFRDGRRH
jgi:hypothetical protein